MIKRILVALSGTPFTDSAISHAIELAKVHDAQLTGVTVVDPTQLESVGQQGLRASQFDEGLAQVELSRGLRRRMAIRGQPRKRG